MKKSVVKKAFPKSTAVAVKTQAAVHDFVDEVAALVQKLRLTGFPEIDPATAPVCEPRMKNLCDV
jgi:hypothetical protein